MNRQLMPHNTAGSRFECHCSIRALAAASTSVTLTCHRKSHKERSCAFRASLIRSAQTGTSGAKGKTGTRAFMAIGALLGEQHSFMHDPELLFWVCCSGYAFIAMGRRRAGSFLSLTRGTTSVRNDGQRRSSNLLSHFPMPAQLPGSWSSPALVDISLEDAT
jgi:hypothetical protein